MIENRTPFAASVLPYHSPMGKAQRVLVVKATFDLNGNVATGGNGLPIYDSNEYVNVPGLHERVLRFESDAVPQKTKLDVIINAVAYAPHAKAVPYFDAGVEIAGKTQTIRVFGPRVWRNRLGVLPFISAPEPVQQMPVVYPLAFGGQVAGNPLAVSRQNPTGMGFTGGLPQGGTALAHIEWVDELVTSPASAPLPAGFGCYGESWSPRADALGRYTAAELAQRGLASRMPKSFSPSSWNCANPRMQFEPFALTAGSVVRLTNLSQGGALQITIPDVQICLRLERAGESELVFPRFDTLAVEPEWGHMGLIWRHALDEQTTPVNAVKLQLTKQ